VNPLDKSTVASGPETLRTLEDLGALIETTATIARIESVRSTIQPNVTHVVVTDTDGVTGLGETFYGSSSVEAHLHDVIVPTLEAEKPHANPRSVSAVVDGYVGYSGSGAEVRARSALDIALWDIAAKRHNLPLRALLNPSARSSIDSYNTCSGVKYVNAESRQSSSNWGFSGNNRPEGDFEDLWAFLNEPARLARELVDAGFKGMKVWPFDLVAESSRGGIDADLSYGLSVLDAIRNEVGMEIELYLELHSLWQPEAAARLVTEVERFSLAWVEDPIRADRVASLAQLRNRASMPIACGENLGSGANGYSAMIEQHAVDVMIMDLGWCGGITEALPLISQTRAAGMTSAFHDCTGPVSLAAATEVSLASPNTTVQEVARAFWHGWYPQMASGYPQLVGGELRASDVPGHGCQLDPDFLNSPDTTIRQSLLK
jgi:L-alanine-DL-glutamate epimerase-like enolase superfamily enzyme